MDIKDKLLSVASDIHDTLLNSAIGHVDSFDTDTLEEGDKCTFNLYEDVDVPNPGGRIFKTRPFGRVVYKVTVEASWEPFD